MGHGDGRPGTPGPGGGGGGAGGGDTKATYSGGVVLVAIISFVLGTIAVAVPYWGLFRPQTGETRLPLQYQLLPCNPTPLVSCQLSSQVQPSHVYSDNEEGEGTNSHLV